MKKKRILLIVTGGVASYKALELLRLLVKDNFDLERDNLSLRSI